MPVFYYKHSPGEPNDVCQQAHPLSPNVVYNFYPDDPNDWYNFELHTSGKLTVQVDNFVPLAGQVAVYRGNSCDNLIFLGSNGNFGTTKIVDLGPQPPGKYYLYVSNDGILNNVNPYKLEIKTN
jgi:hypothetical protein